MGETTEEGRLKTLISFPVLAAVAAKIGGGLFLIGFAGTAASQLTAVPGITELQQPVAAAVDELCPKLPPPNSTGNLTERLSNSCTLLVVSSLGNQGHNVPPQYNLQISNGEILTGVQAIAPVQMNAQKQISTEAAKVNLLSARLLDLRGGSRGFIVGSNGRNAQQTGGAAGADDPLDGRLGGFLNLGYSWGNVDQTTLQDAYKYDSFNLLAGVDYRVNDSFILGGAIGYSDTHSNYDQSLGKVKASTLGVAGYGTYYVDDWYVDGFVAYGSVDYDSTRNIFIPSHNPAAAPITGSATASPKGDQWSASIGVGRNFDKGTYIVTPTLRLGYIWVKNKAFTENEPNAGLGLAVDERTVRSLQSALGAKLSTNVNTSSGVFGPYFTAQWLHEFENGSPSIISRYIADPANTFFSIPTANPTRDYAVLALGSTATFPNNLSGFLQFSAAVGLQNQTNYALVVGLRKQF